MTFQQLVTPDPDIPCEPGMCLQYVRQTFGAPIVEPTATEGWNRAQYKHTDYDFPEGVAVPLWFAIPGVPAGHVVLRMPDGSIYSTSDESTTPHHHPDLNDLVWYYGPRVQPEYQLQLQYLGWSEDISGVRVVEEISLSFQSESITPLEDDMPITDDDAAKVARFVLDAQVDREGGGTNTLRWSLSAEAQRTEGIISRTAEATTRLLLGTKLPRQGDGQSGDTDLGSVIAWSDSNFTHAGTANVGASVGLEQDQVNAAIKAGLDAALNGTSATITLGGGK